MVICSTSFILVVIQLWVVSEIGDFRIDTPNSFIIRVFHGSELLLIYGGAPSSEESLATAFTDAYINFIVGLNPGCKYYSSRIMICTYL